MAQYNISNNSFGTSTKSNYEVVMIANSSGQVVSGITNGTTGKDYSSNKPTIPLLGNTFSGSPYNGYVVLSTVSANTSRNNISIENTSGSQIVVVRDDGTQSGNSPLTNASLFSLSGGIGVGYQGGSWSSNTFKGRLQIYAASNTAFVSVMED